jgi:glyoxylase I family protein
MAFAIKGLTPLLQVFDMPTSVRFYCDHLGFALVTHSPLNSAAEHDFGWCLLRRDAFELMLNTAYDLGERPDHPEAARIAAHGDTCLFLGCPEVDEACTQLRAAGLAVEGPTVQRYGMKQIYLNDPDGFGVCLQWPVKPS